MRLVEPRVWTSQRKWLGNVVPFLFWLPPTATGVVWILRTNQMLGPGLLLILAGQVAGWLALNQFGLWENGRMRRDAARSLQHRRPPPTGPVVFVGFSTPKHQSLLDIHEDVGFLAFGPDAIEFIGDDRRIRLLRQQVREVRFRPNIHTWVGLGRWVSIEGEVNGLPVRMLLESRECNTMLGNLQLSRWLLQLVEQWRRGEPVRTQRKEGEGRRV